MAQLKSGERGHAPKIEFQLKEVFVNSYTTNSDDLIKAGEALFRENPERKHPEAETPERRNARMRLSNALAKLQDHFQNDSRELHRAIQLFNDTLNKDKMG